MKSSMVKRRQSQQINSKQDVKSSEDFRGKKLTSYPSSHITGIPSLYVVICDPPAPVVCRKDPWPIAGYPQLAEQFIPGFCRKTRLPPWLQHISVLTGRVWVETLLNPLPPQVLAKTHCLFQRLFPRLGSIRVWEWPIWDKQDTMKSSHL